MNNKPTPETDDAAQPSSLLQYETVNANFARKLERERDEARAERNEARFLLKAAQSALDAIHLEFSFPNLRAKLPEFQQTK